jgi:SAM-dependent methyltransferase
MANSSPDNWLQKNFNFLPSGCRVLDLACGSGRNARFLLSQGFHVTCVDIDTREITDLESHSRCTVIQADLESGDPPSFQSRFGGIIVTNYLYRPLLPFLIESLAEGGVLIYKTFMEGNEQFGRPSNPDFLLQKDELYNVFSTELDVISFEQGYEDPPAMTQRICARK